MFGSKQILNQLLQTKGSASAAGVASSLMRQAGGAGLPGGSGVTGALTGALTGSQSGGLLGGLLRGGGTRRGPSLTTVASAAMLSTVASRAMRSWRSKKRQNTATRQNQPAAQPPESPEAVLDFDALPAADAEKRSRAMLAAIIAAAKADGTFDQREREMIKEQTDQQGDPEAVAWVQQEIRKPLDVDQIAALADSPEMAAEIYLASLLIIDEQNAKETAYLEALAEKMNLAPDLRREIEQEAKKG